MRFTVQPADLAAATAALSTARLSSYRRFFVTASDGELYGLYRWNEAVSMHLFKTLSLAEVAVRNQFHIVLSNSYGTVGHRQSKDWYNHLNLPQKSRETLQKVTHRRHHGTWLPKTPVPSPDDVISKLTFGFWPHLLNVTRDTHGGPVDWSSLLAQILAGHRQRNNATYWTRRHQDAVFARLDLCNSIRNRIAHHEPIWKCGPLLEERRERPGAPRVAQVEPAPSNEKEALARLALYYSRMQELLGWMSPPLLDLHRATETHYQIEQLLSPKGVAYFRRLGRTQTLDIEKFRTLRSFKKQLKQLAKRGAPVRIRRNSVSIGHWMTIGY